MNGSLKCYCNLAAADSLLHIFPAAGVYLSYHIIVIHDNPKISLPLYSDVAVGLCLTLESDHYMDGCPYSFLYS